MAGDGAVGGRPKARHEARRAPRLRVKRKHARREKFDLALGKAVDLPSEVQVVADYVRSALRGNAAVVGVDDYVLIRQALTALADYADRINERAAKQANKEGNTPRRTRERKESA